jgi:phosphoribosyl 1,2-cyclic phosphate phosphodiesterase
VVFTTASGKNLLVDTGPDLRLQLVANRIGRVDAIVYTHAHADHVAGLDEIRILNRLLGAPMPAYAEEQVWAELRVRFDYAFRPWTGGQSFFRPVLDIHVINPPQIVDIVGLKVAFLAQDHGYISSLGLRVGGIAYCTDVRRLDEAALAALAGIEVFVVDCFTRHDAHPTHANLAQVLEWVARLRPRRTILTHLGPSMDWAWGLRNLPEGVELGYDGMSVAAG